LGVRIFNNLGVIRRHYLNKWTTDRSPKKEDSR
jgi:small basic protein